MVKRFDNWRVNSASLDPSLCRSITMDLNSQGFPNCSVLLWRISKWEGERGGHSDGSAAVTGGLHSLGD